MGPARCVGGPSSANNPSSHGGKVGSQRLEGYTDSYVQLARETMSSSSSSIAVSVSKSTRSRSPGPPSSAGTCPQWCRALSAKSHSARR